MPRTSPPSSRTSRRRARRPWRPARRRRPRSARRPRTFSPARVSIYDAAAANRVRTAVLLVSLVFIVVVLAYFVGEYLAGGSGVAIVPIAFLIAVGSAWVSYFAGDKLILAQSRARELGPDEEKVLRDITETLAVGLGVPAPRLYVIEDSAPNAFATGRDPAHASLVVTPGLLQN